MGEGGALLRQALPRPLPQAGGGRTVAILILPSRLREGSGEGLLDKGYKRPTARSRELRLNATDAERKLWAQLSARKIAGVRFNRQLPIGPLICDFVSRSAKLVIEVDGGQHAVDVAKDEARTAYLETRG